MVDEGQREHLYALVKAGSDLKLQRGAGEAAWQKLEEAMPVAEALGNPWAALVAYRLAHLRMRTARGPEDFDDADALFAKAARSAVCGPLASAYRLAAMHRAGADRSRLQDAFDRAAKRLQRPMDVDGPMEPRLQDEGHNLLELAAYFLGISTQSLEGRGSLVLGPDDWALVGPDPMTCQVSYPRELAVEELKARGEREPGAFLYVLEAEPDDDRWKQPGRRVWTRPPARFLMLLALLQAREVRSRAALESAVMAEGTSGAFRVAKNRLCEALGIDADDLIVDSTPEAPRLQPGRAVFAYGAVCRARLSSST
jgi:hypothetical protein